MDLRKLQFIKRTVDIDKAIKSGGLVYDNPPKKRKKEISQRDAYAKAMYGATRRGGSDGKGVGY